MSESYSYFVKVFHGELDGPWRRNEEGWQYLSLLDWRWHRSGDGRPVRDPSPDELRPISSEEATTLAQDRQRWVRYWAEFDEVRDDRPVTVIRRRSSPERVLDEHFTTANAWHPTDSLVVAQQGDRTGRRRVVEIDRSEAERLIEQFRGVAGATAL